jgi:hypothetical protein
LEPDFFIRGRVIQEYQVLKLGFIKQIRFYKRFGFNFHEYGEYLAAVRDYEGADEFTKEEIRLGPHTRRTTKTDLGEEGPHSFTYTVLQAIKQGYNTQEQLMGHFK